MDYITAMNYAVEGKKVRQKCWEGDYYVTVEDDDVYFIYPKLGSTSGRRIPFVTSKQLILATDWEIIESEESIQSISRTTVYFHNDPSVGIQSTYYSIELPIEKFEDEEHREEVRKLIQNLYTELDGEFAATRVIFGDETD